MKTILIADDEEDGPFSGLTLAPKDEDSRGH